LLPRRFSRGIVCLFACDTCLAAAGARRFFRRFHAGNSFHTRFDQHHRPIIRDGHRHGSVHSHGKRLEWQHHERNIFNLLSSNTNYASINSSGLATGVGSTTQITASANGITSQPFVLTVTAHRFPRRSRSADCHSHSRACRSRLRHGFSARSERQGGHRASGSVTLALGHESTSATSRERCRPPLLPAWRHFPISPSITRCGYTLTASFAGVPSATSSAFILLPSHTSRFLSKARRRPCRTGTRTPTPASGHGLTTSTLLLPSLESNSITAFAVPGTGAAGDGEYSTWPARRHSIALTGKRNRARPLHPRSRGDCANTTPPAATNGRHRLHVRHRWPSRQSPAAGGFSGFRRSHPSARISRGPDIGLATPGACVGIPAPLDRRGRPLSDFEQRQRRPWGTSTALWTSSLTTDPSTENGPLHFHEILNILPAS